MRPEVTQIGLKSQTGLKFLSVYMRPEVKLKLIDSVYVSDVTTSMANSMIEIVRLTSLWRNPCIAFQTQTGLRSQTCLEDGFEIQIGLSLNPP